MPARVAYWCSSFDGDMEAIAGEVATLRRAFPGSVTWGIAARQWMRLSPQTGFGVHPRLHWLFRGATWAAQQWYDVQHLFGGLGDWFHLRAVAKRPVVMTVAAEGAACDRRLLDKVDRFVVEWPGAAEKLLELGFGQDRVRTILPPVELERFQATPLPTGPFTVCFASSPDRADWLEARGVDLLLDAATRCPNYRFLLVWRPWGNSLPRVRQWVADRGLMNVEIKVGKFDDMSQFYRQSHVTVAPFVDLSRCKPMPNSVAESLACGRPVVVTKGVGIAPILNVAGMVTEPTVNSLVAALECVEGSLSSYSSAARLLAEDRFSAERFVASYGQLYQELT